MATHLVRRVKTLHTCIMKVNQGLQATLLIHVSVHFMICVNELTTLKCNNKELAGYLLYFCPFLLHIFVRRYGTCLVIRRALCLHPILFIIEPISRE